MVIAYLAEQFKYTEHTTITTTIGYAKQADDYRVIAGIFTMMLAANLLPYLVERLSYASEKDAIKAKLKEYVLSKSDIDRSTITGKVYSIALDATIENIIKSKAIDLNQIKIALASIEIGASAQNYYNR